MTYEKKAMTAFAQAALAASDLIMQKFHETKFSGNVTRVVNVEAPNVESTGGGKQARESIVLRAENGDPAHSVTAGFLDIGLRSCELRSYAALNVQHRARFQTALDLHQSEYDKFLGELKTMLESEGFVIKVIEPEERQARAAAADSASPKAGGSSNMGLFIGIGVVAAIAVVALVAVLVLK